MKNVAIVSGMRTLLSEEGSNKNDIDQRLHMAKILHVLTMMKLENMFNDNSRWQVLQDPP